ncbi:MAG: hypothetical protein D6B25_11950 [Desulfobulbaceae bacterium]|nr:MAG: hypothetical protein D6B25_11950 [Desulfobulbaceae bacterium]
MTQLDGTVLYESSTTRLNQGNRYALYGDRIELSCKFFFCKKTFVIFKDDLYSISLHKPPVVRTTWWALKLDLADLSDHVGLHRKRGIFKELRFTPDNPDEFVATVNRILELP